MDRDTQMTKSEKHVPTRQDSVRYGYEKLGWSFVQLKGKVPTKKGWARRGRERLQDALVQYGIIDAQTKQGLKPLTDHLTDWEAFMKSQGRNPQHISQQVGKARQICTQCGFVHLADMRAEPVARFMLRLREGGKSLKPLRLQDGASLATVNHYIGAIKSFAIWLWKNDRTADNPMKALSKTNASVDRRRVRRTLSLDEIQKLLETTASADDFMGITGAERALAYKTALLTGLRRGELRGLRARDLDFEFDPARLIVREEVAKTGVEAVLPLRADLAAELQQHCRDKLPNAPVFRLPRWKAHKMIQHDLGLAEIAVTNDDGVVDWHSLRHTFVRALAKSGVPVGGLQDAGAAQAG